MRRALGLICCAGLLALSACAKMNPGSGIAGATGYASAETARQKALKENRACVLIIHSDSSAL